MHTLASLSFIIVVCDENNYLVALSSEENSRFKLTFSFQASLYESRSVNVARK